jgi:uncharacterized protein (UPF0332 family)/heme exporter protein D
MKKLALVIFLFILVSSSNGFSISNNEVNGKISEIEKVTHEYQNLILNLNSQGAYTSKSIKLFSDMKDLIWQAKMLLNENDPENANRNLEEAKSIAPRITMDVRFSLEINKGRLALERALSLIGIARREGYAVNALEEYYDKASSLFDEAKELYKNEEYDKIDSKIGSVLELTDKISNKIENLKNPYQTSESSPTGFMIADYSWLSPYIIGIMMIALVTLVIVKIRRRKKELKGISKLVRIKCRLE